MFTGARRCPWGAARGTSFAVCTTVFFSVVTARLPRFQGQDSVPPRAQLRTYPVLEKHGWVWVWMGRSEDADPTLIPELVGVDDQHYLMVSGRQDWDTEANLISENLLDFSHLTYVHQQSFGSGSEFAEIQPNWDVLPRRYPLFTLDAQH